MKIYYVVVAIKLSALFLSKLLLSKLLRCRIGTMVCFGLSCTVCISYIQYMEYLHRNAYITFNTRNLCFTILIYYVFFGSLESVQVARWKFLTSCWWMLDYQSESTERKGSCTHYVWSAGNSSSESCIVL